MASLAYQAAGLRIYSVAPGVSCAIQCSPWCSSVVGEAQRPPPGIGFVSIGVASAAPIQGPRE